MDHRLPRPSRSVGCVAGLVGVARMSSTLTLGNSPPPAYPCPAWHYGSGSRIQDRLAAMPFIGGQPPCPPVIAPPGSRGSKVLGISVSRLSLRLPTAIRGVGCIRRSVHASLSRSMVHCGKHITRGSVSSDRVGTVFTWQRVRSQLPYCTRSLNVVKSNHGDIYGIA